MTWNDTLKQYSNRALEAMCNALQIPEDGGKVSLSNRQRVIDRLTRALGKPETVHHSLSYMGPVETAMLKALIRLGGAASAEQVRRAMGQEVSIQSPDKPLAANYIPNPHYQGLPRFEDAAARALVYGLIFSRDNKEIDLAPGNQLIIPQPVLNTLRSSNMWKKMLARDDIAISAPVIAPDVSMAFSAEDFQRDLSRYLRLVRRQGQVALTTQGWVYKTNFKNFLAALNMPADSPGDEGSNARLWFMRRLLVAMGNILYTDTFTQTGTQMGMQANPQGDLLSLPVAERIKRGFEVWHDSGTWNELNRVATEHHGYDYRRDAPPELAKARSAILRLLTRLSASAIAATHSASQRPAPEAWVSTVQLIELARRQEYQFLFPRKVRPYYSYSGNYSTPYYNANNPYNMDFPSIFDEQQGWDLVERQFIVNMLTGPLYWMGVVGLGYPKGTTPGEGVEPYALRLTEVGAWLLGLGDQPTFIESGGRVLVQPNFTIIAMEPVSDAVLLALDEFADSQGGDRAISYHLTRASMYRGQRQGWTAQRISAFLEQHQGGPLPANVQRSLEEWQALHQRITIHRGVSVLHYADEAAREGAHQALQSSSVSLHRLSATFDRVERAPNQPATSLSNTLADAGWMPLVTSTETDMAHTESSLRVNAAGEVTFKQAVPSLFTLRQIASFSAHTGERIHIDAASVRAAMSRGMSLDELLATLAHLHDGPLPRKLETNIRTWAGFYGQAALRPVHLLELSTPAVLNNLLQDAQVGPYLHPIESSTRALALVDAEHVDEVRTVLAERGVTLQE
jgi:hypothetical protein